MRMIQDVLRPVLCLLLAFSFYIIPAHAVSVVEESEIRSNEFVLYTAYISNWKNELTINNGSANIQARVSGNSSNTTKCKIVARLQRKTSSGWTTVETWTVTKNAKSASLNKSKSVTSGKKYRSKATITVYVGSKSETKTLISATKRA